jgi:hypothetical protein
MVSHLTESLRIDKTDYPSKYLVNLMSSPAITTIVKMVESLPEELQERVLEHVQEYIAEIEAERQWGESFRRTKRQLVEAARKAKTEIAAGLSIPMDYDQL